MTDNNLPQATKNKLTESILKNSLFAYQTKAQHLLKNTGDTFQMLKKATIKAEKNKTHINQIFHNVNLMLSISKDYVTGNYKEIPLGSFIAILGGITYFIAPIDLIPDFILSLGYIDDISILGLVISQVNSDLNKYENWKNKTKTAPSPLPMQEIERKFLVKTLPDLSGKDCIGYERYFLKIEADYEDRIQKKGDKFEREIKVKSSDLSRQTEKQAITEEEFDKLKESASKSIIRDSYKLSDNPDLTIKIYHGDYQGLIRAEVEFTSETEAEKFQPYAWMGKEITHTNLGQDSKLIQLDKPAFQELLKTVSQS